MTTTTYTAPNMTRPQLVAIREFLATDPANKLESSKAFNRVIGQFRPATNCVAKAWRCIDWVAVFADQFAAEVHPDLAPLTDGPFAAFSS